MKNYYINGCIDTYKKLLNLVDNIKAESETDSLMLDTFKIYLKIQLDIKEEQKDKIAYCDDITESYREFLKIQEDLIKQKKIK